jgi:gluconolactonase
MRQHLLILSILANLFCVESIGQEKPIAMSQTDQKKSNIIADNAKLELISSQFAFTEGPATDKQGNVFFTDQPNNRIWKYSIDGSLSIFLENAGRSNGMYFDREGNLITCADEQNQLWQIGPDGKTKVLLNDFGGLHFNGPNDLWISPSSGLYFTDPYYQRDYWTRKASELSGQKVYFLEKNKKPVIVADDLVQPNGIIGTPDGKYLYVADIGDGKTYRYKTVNDGKLVEKHLFASMGSDGMTIDEQGNIYLTGNGVTVYSKEGKLIVHIPVHEEWTGNVTFGGEENNMLFITASKSVYILKMKVKGAHK